MREIDVESTKPRKLFESKLDGQLFYVLTERGKVKLVSRERPVLVEIFPSLDCNLNCASCDRGAEASILEDFNDVRELYDNLSMDPEFHMLNFRISGKEPTLYPRLNGLISFLHRLDPCAGIELFTNAIKLEILSTQSLSRVELLVSIYPDSQKILCKNVFVRHVFKSKGFPFRVNVRFHENLLKHGTIRNDFDPLSHCFNPVLLCGTRKVYPCCRAHKFEQMYGKNYHLEVASKNLYKQLKVIVKNSNLCSHCPRVYGNYDRVAVRCLGKNA